MKSKRAHSISKRENNLWMRIWPSSRHLNILFSEFDKNIFICILLFGLLLHFIIKYTEISIVLHSKFDAIFLFLGMIKKSVAIYFCDIVHNISVTFPAPNSNHRLKFLKIHNVWKKKLFKRKIKVWITACKWWKQLKAQPIWYDRKNLRLRKRVFWLFKMLLQNQDTIASYLYSNLSITISFYFSFRYYFIFFNKKTLSKWCHFRKKNCAN